MSDINVQYDVGGSINLTYLEDIKQIALEYNCKPGEFPVLQKDEVKKLIDDLTEFYNLM